MHLSTQNSNHLHQFLYFVNKLYVSISYCSMVSKADANNEWWKLAKPGSWNDPGMLEVGIAEMTITEYKAHFSLWALMKVNYLWIGIILLI